MAYAELIKNFEKVREYMREFYVYGFKSRDEFTMKSARSYDDERRRIENWLGEYMGFRTGPNGKNVFISIDSRNVKENPLYKAWKTCSFTDKDITLHFLVFDILKNSPNGISIKELCDVIDEYLVEFEEPYTFDESTVRKKMKEYAEQGLIISRKEGKTVIYHYRGNDISVDSDAVSYFSEISPCGVIGSFIMDREDIHNELFSFKHHYITQAMDSDILAKLFIAISEKRWVTVKNCSRRSKNTVEACVVPLKLFVSSQNGRQYIIVYHQHFKRIMSYRLDYIVDVKMGDICNEFADYADKLSRMQKHMWGVSADKDEENVKHIEFTVRFEEYEGHIYRRLLREKRCGTVELINKGLCKFSADVYDEKELIPWIRTFICRIVSINFTDKTLEESFKEDIRKMYELYNLEGGVE